MSSRYAVATAGLLLVAMQTPIFTAPAIGQPLPVVGGRPVVATVNRESISLDELATQLAPPVERARLRQGRANARELELLDRLVTIKLVSQEAATTGLDEVPEIRKQIEVASREILREVLIERLVRPVKPDPRAVEQRFRDMVREWKTTSLLFQDEAEARRIREQLGKGAEFSDVAAKAVAAKRARMDGDANYHPRKDYLPQIAQAVAVLRAGQVSPVIRLQSGFAVVQVVDIRYPPNPQARDEARRQVLREQQLAFMKAHEDAARRTSVVVNKAVLKSVDFSAAQPGLNGLLKDKRAIAEIKGGPALTVADLADYLRMQFFHGTDQAKQRKEMNDKKEAALEAMIGRRLLNVEAARLGIDKTHAYRDRVRGYRESLVFDSFVQRVIVPGSKMKEDEVKRHFDTHPKEYSYPEMIKVRSLAFTARGPAESALGKLRTGTDYGWLAANADAQVPKGAPGLLTFEPRPVTIDSMPEGMRKALAGAKAGDHKLYASPEGHYYVLVVQQVIASNPKPYDEVRQQIAQTLYAEKLKNGIDAYAAKLRAHSKVVIHLKKVR